MARNDCSSVSGSRKRNSVCLRRVEYIRFVGFQNAQPNFAICQSENEVVRMVFGPDHACHCCADWKFVADCLLLSPVQPNFVDENDVITLSDSYFLWIRWEFQSSYEIAFLSLVRRLGGEFIFPLPILVEDIDGLNKRWLTLSAAPTANFLPDGAQVMAETFFMLS